VRQIRRPEGELVPLIADIGSIQGDDAFMDG
jgi:hypothetical protein